MLLIYFVSAAQTRYDTFISVTHHDSVDALYYYPDQPPPGGGYPAILTIHGFGDSKESRVAYCLSMARQGFVALAYSVRGQGNSQGLSTIMSYEERSDLQYVFNYLKQLPNVNPDAIGVVGGSQGGLHALWAAMDCSPVQAITADVIVPHWATDMLMNGCIRRTLLNLLKTQTVRYAPLRDTLWNMVRSDSYDELLHDFPRDRDVDTRPWNQISVPMMMLLKWQDHYFTATDGIDFFQHQGMTKKMYLGTVGHWSDGSTAEQSFQWDQMYRWNKQFVQHTETGILDEPQMMFAYSSLHVDTGGSFNWNHEPTAGWPLSGVSLFQCYLHADSSMSFSPVYGTADSFRLENKYLNPSYTFDTAFVEGFKGSRFDVLLPKQTLVFTSTTLREDVLWAGAPRMRLYVHSMHERFPLHAQIYEVDSAGNEYFINRINFTARHWTPGASGWIEVKGIPHAHKFTHGNRIRIMLTNNDTTPRKVLGNYPFVLPLFEETGVTIYADAEHPSYIEIPFIGDPTSVTYAAEGIPREFELMQNYPNPFNAQTSIGYTITTTGRVRLSVYNTLGQEVAVLVNGVQDAGVKRESWNAGSAASGVYFYRVVFQPLDWSPVLTAVKKMILLK
jgi:predicted acyl esterase